LMSELAAKGVPSRKGESLHASMKVASSSVIHANRENIALGALKEGATHLLFLDDDMEFNAKVVDLLFSRRQAVVTSNYLIKNKAKDKFVAMSSDMMNRIPTLPESTGVVPIGFSGFGVSLFEMDVFKKLPQPWFLPKWNIHGGNTYTTEDYPFFQALREAGIPCYLDQDASKFVRHLGLATWSWEDFHG
jgi:hypothetical protein